MDPTANLAEQLRIAVRIAEGKSTESDHDRLAELVLALHEWILAGGFPPEQWPAIGEKALFARKVSAVRAVLRRDREATVPADVSRQHLALRTQLERVLQGAP